MVTSEIAAAQITSNQITAMSSAQVVGLSDQLALKQNASSALTTTQVDSMITAAIGELATAPVSSVAGRTGAVTLTTADIAGLSSAPVTSVAGRTGAVALTTSDIGGLSTLAVTTAQIVGLDARTDSRIAGASITTAQISGLTSVPLSSTQINALTLQTNQITGFDARVDSRIASGAMTTSQITGLSAALATKLDASGSIATSQVTGLQSMVTSQIASAAITTAQVTGFDSRVDSRIASGSMTTAQITGLSTALSGKSNTGHTHTASQVTDFSTAADARIAAAAGVSVCPLSGGLVPSGYLPSYVDDVLEYANLAGFPGTGTTGKIYVDLATNKTYRWSGSVYVEISSSPGSTDSVTEGSVNLYHTSGRADARVQAAKGSATPAMNGAAAAGSATTWSPVDHIHPTDTSRAPLNNPTFTGNAGVLAPFMQVRTTRDLTTIVASAATGTINYDALTQGRVYYTTNASGNWTLNIRGDGSNTLNSLMAVGESVSLEFWAAQGATPYWNNVLQVDGSAQTIKWLGTTPTGGNASGIDTYAYTILKTAANTYTVLGSQTKFA
jgi:hypothetical protein